MIPVIKSTMLSALVLCCVPVTAAALTGGSVLDNPASSITRQVERNAERLVERAADRRIESRLEEKAGIPEEGLQNLPEVLTINTAEGEKAFNDVLLEDGFRAVERQWLVAGTAEEIKRLDHPGITVLEQKALDGLGMIIARFRVRADMDSLEALRIALPELADRLDRNHTYSPQAGTSSPSGNPLASSGESLCEAPVRIGMIDTSVATDHADFRDARVVEQRFLSIDDAAGELSSVTAHGTAVAGQLVGRRGESGQARLPAATLFNASVFYRRTEDLSGATLGHLLEGLNWLAAQQLSVINISLTGPNNRLLAAAIKNLQKQGTLLVAAVGNDGPTAPPLYPAAYPEVVGVTATSRTGELYRWANRGDQVMFAAHGVEVEVSHPGGGTVTDSGTSLAAPVVAAALACQVNGSDDEMALEALIDQAQDLGEPGRDGLFGFGFLPY
ncbi:S8 family serine peptidase [Marinobacter sp. F3R08]|uniref:S8 family serine peptidase n=1 Tax=Marinobacter sp. F3R08 TaxID=2841559 RepID=UPI001C088D4F|nr:S8 family serine peptidase [Marinobacter sp. F3R08]MBU2952627.1 S8 family serine peptidase [Marinobacter sp. F3R08]